MNNNNLIRPPPIVRQRGFSRDNDNLMQPPPIVRQPGFSRDNDNLIQSPPVVRQRGFIIRDDEEDYNENNYSTGFGSKRNKKKIKSEKKIVAGRVRTIHTGPRGGKYYIKNKKKVYI